MTTNNDELDYVAVVDGVLGSVPAAHDMDRGQALRVYGTVAELDGLLLSGAPAVEITTTAYLKRGPNSPHIEFGRSKSEPGHHTTPKTQTKQGKDQRGP